MSRNVGRRVGGQTWHSIVDFSAPAHPPIPLALYTTSTLFRYPLPALLRSTTSRSLSDSPFSRSYLPTTAGLGLRCIGGHLPPVRPEAERGSVTKLAATAWRRHIHSRARRKGAAASTRKKSSLSNGTPNPREEPPAKPVPQAELSPTPQKTESPKPSSEAPASASKPLLDRLPHLPQNIHRPTKEELLAAATGFWSRLRVRFKWFSIKSARPFNMDEISAFFSWILVGHVVWILVGTTTFFSLAILMVNTVFAQETLAQWIGNYLTKSSGVKVIFESAIVPNWRDGVISFKNVFVSRRPGQGQSKVIKGSQTSAAAAAAAAALAERAGDDGKPEEEDTNYTQFDLSIDTVNVTLSFAKWFNGKGLLRDVEVKGIRGVVDRTSVHAPEVYIDPRTYKHEHYPGDFEIDSFKMEDLLVTVYQPLNFRPFSVSIFACDLPQLRKQYLFYDFLSANTMSGSFDNSLFTIHPRQTHNYTGAQLSEGRDDPASLAGEPAHWKKHSRIRIDGLSIDHLNRGINGPFSWIHEGNVDIVADIMFPADNAGSIAKVMSDFYDRVEATVTDLQNGVADHNRSVDEQVAKSSAEHYQKRNDDDERFLIIDLRVHLNDVRAAVPLFTKDISYINNALVRPIVAYINSKKTFIPVNCRVVKRASEFDGSWTIYDSGLMEDVSREMYEAFARDVLNDHQARKRRFKKVGIWTIQLAAQALFIGLAGHVA
ncbi:Mitochondrial distribution and morphology protein 31, mitochondrial precursor [Coniosporium apollinis]|uniref:Mitochondrial distribution and morphology protein 31, mitochondrial n=1 Tax=Coniosporium apollinis TaxID=61459 RepID=A0ABQ9NP83_9PEZI|nr:Mitochondrial distribution and morphology protein 31, mitochondrial precursor [Coniosporium apollinis]